MDVEEDHYGLRVSPAMDITITVKGSILFLYAVASGRAATSPAMRSMIRYQRPFCNAGTHGRRSIRDGSICMYVLFGSVREEARWRRRKSGGSLPRVRDR